MPALVDRLLRRAGEARALTRDNVPETMLGWPTVAGGPVGEREALRLVDVLACVRVISETASTLPLVPYRRLDGGDRQRITAGRLPELLARPAPAVTQSALVGHLVASLALRGNAFLGLYAGPDGQVQQLGVIPPDRVQVEVVGGSPVYTLTHADGHQTRHGPDDIVHARLPLTLDGVLGLSPLQQAREALGLNRALAEEASALAVNGSAPRGVLTVQAGPGSDDLIENLRAAWEGRHGGPRNAGRVAVLAGDIGFKPVGLSAADAEFVEQRRLSTQEIARLFLVPPWMVNAPSNDAMTYSNAETQAQAFLTFTLQPYLVAVEQAVSNSPLCAGPSVFVEALTDAVLRPDSLARANVYALALGNETAGQPGWMTRREVRQREGLAPEQEGSGG